MLNYRNFKHIYLCCNEISFRGGIKSFQIKVRTFFNEEDVLNCLFIFTNKKKDQLKMYYETSKGCNLLNYKVYEDHFKVTLDGKEREIDKRQTEWLIDCLSVIKE